MDRLLHDPVPVVVVDGGDRPVDRDLGEVRSTEPRQLGVEVGEEPSVQQGIVDDVDPRDEVSRVERDLFGLGEVVRRVAVKGHAPDDANRAELLGHQLGRVEQIDALEGLLLRVWHDLDAQLPLRRVAGGDPLVEVAPVEVGIDPAELLGLLPHQPVHPGDRLPMPLHQARRPVAGDEAERVDAEALHRGERTRDRPVGHDPHQHVGRLRLQRREVPERVVGRLRLGDLAIGFGLHRVDQVRELQSVLDEEDRDVVADEIEVALARIELRGETSHVTSGVRRAT